MKPADNQSVKDRPPLPWRVFGVIGLLIVVTAYSALNLENRSDVSLGVYTFRGVPVFLTSLIALILGAVLVVPLTLRTRVRRQAAAIDEDAAVAAEPLSDEPEPEPASSGADATPLPDGPDDEQEPEDAPRRRVRWPFGARASGPGSGRRPDARARRRRRPRFWRWRLTRERRSPRHPQFASGRGCGTRSQPA